jgi:diguanylate cyclase (GGDEF)-like protein
LQAPSQDLLYFGLRIVLSAMTVVVSVVCLRSALRSRRNGHPAMIPTCGTLLLCAASALSAYDAISNVIFEPDTPIPTANWFWYLLFDLPMLVWALLAIKAREERDRAYEALSKLSVTDPLTGILNRRGFFDRAISAIANSRRTGTSPAVMMLDIDHFKSINDNHGHETGDAVLRYVADTLASELRAGDLLGRLGGEEFGVLLSDSHPGPAAATAERIRAAIRTRVHHPGGLDRSVTASCGIAYVPDRFEPEAAFSFALNAADGALYSAKRQGRDRTMSAVVTVDPGPQASVAQSRDSAIAPQDR